jgi:transketolase
VLPKTAKLRVSVEAGISQGWREYVGDSGLIISIDHFGASAGATKLFTEFGFTVDRIVSDIQSALK